MTELERCHLAALRILNYRFNSTAELRRKLRSKKFEAAVIEETLVRLESEKWLDDGRFAAALVRTKLARRIGPRRIARELSAAGIDEEKARLILRDHADPERERRDLAALCEKRRLLLIRRRGEEYASSPEGRNKLAVYLLNQGYDAALVYEIVGVSS
ncbi:MAG TPA: regulatory protein RecX [Thermoanaerobaculia bacterium]|nr:regulatory protein RecX [Thermoanaerobaculia bacterium]